MGWEDTLRNVGRIGIQLASEGFRAAEGWAEERANEARMDDFDDRINKAAGQAKRNGNDGTHDLAPGADGKPIRDPKAVHFDPFDIVAAMGYRERPTTLTFQAMEMIGRGVPVIADIVGTRVKQVSMFCEQPEDRYSPGFKVRRRDWRERKPTKKDEREARKLENIVLNTGYYVPEEPHKTVSLREFASTFVSDSLIFDQATFEMVPDRLARPSYLALTDPSTIRLLDPAARSPDDPFAVQVINGAIVEAFTHDELAFCIRNPRSGIRSYGYGTSEIETLVREITGLLWGMDYNRKMFTNGSATKGILNFKGTIPDRHLQSFRRQWYAMISGVTNAWRTPITNAEELQWINMQMSNRDMEYSAWMDFLIKIGCARYNIATEEVNFSYGNTGQSQAMGQAPIEEKLKQSKDLGLRPLVRWFFVQLNRYLVQRINPDFEAIPIGLDERGADAEAELYGKQVKIFKTVNEVRQEAELPPLPEDQGDVILDPTWLQYVQGKEAMAGGGFGEEGEDASGGLEVSNSYDEEGFDITNEDTIKSVSNDAVVRYTVNLPRTDADTGA